DLNTQYLVTFEYNCHKELVINHVFVEANDVTFIEEEQVDSREELDRVERIIGIEREKDRGRSREPPNFILIQNHYLLHREYARLPNDFQLGIVKLLALFQLFFTDKQLQIIIENTNKYEQVKGREGGHAWSSLTLTWELIQDTFDSTKNMSHDEASLLTSSKEKQTLHMTKNYELPMTHLLDKEHLVE
ncbi:5167_t:CDS:2, partial [Cetraspora pellucida]